MQGIRGQEKKGEERVKKSGVCQAGFTRWLTNDVQQGNHPVDTGAFDA